MFFLSIDMKISAYLGNSNKPPWGLIREGGLFVKTSFRGGVYSRVGGSFESGGLIDHLRYLYIQIRKETTEKCKFAYLS